MGDLLGCDTPDIERAGMGCEAVWLDVSEEEKLVVGSVMSDEERCAVVSLAGVVLTVTQGHCADGDMIRDVLVQAVYVQPAEVRRCKKLMTLV